MKRLFCLVLWLMALPVGAHEVNLTVEARRVTVLQLQYADGTPFAYEAYEVLAKDAQIPAQVGRTDAQGRIAFIADRAGTWRLKAWSEDGHGMSREFEVAPEDAVNRDAQPAAMGYARWQLVLLGAGWLLGVFGLWQLFLRKEK